MHRSALIFMKIFVPILSALLAWLGLQTLFLNWMGYFLLICGLVYFFGILYYFGIRKSKTGSLFSTDQLIDEEKRDLSFWLILPGMIVPFFLSPIEFLYFMHLLPNNIGMQLIGMLMLFSFLILFIWARIVIRRNFSGHLQVTSDQQLIQSGPYRFIRHPAYASYLLLTLGISISYSSLIGLGAIIFLLLPGIVYRIKIEEKLLIQRFGQQYIEYSQQTSRLIPGVW